MLYTRTSAKALLNASELELYDMGRREMLARLDRRTLVVKVMRTRRLRDKYRDLFRRQRLATRDRTGSKRGASGIANMRTREKAELFGELLAGFEAQLAKVDAAAKLAAQREAKARAAAARAARKGPSGKAGPAAAPSGKGRLKASASPRAKSAVAKRQLQKTRMVSIHAHVRSQGQRNQAKRDRRRS
ncbi:MAG: hypothetical protein WCA12_04370 [Burkholderiales bacterium]